MMRVVDVLAVPVQAGFFFDDQLAIRAGAGHDGFDYTGEPRIPGFRRVRQPGKAVSVLLVLDDGGVEFGDCAAVQYSGAGGRDPLFTAHDAVAAVEEVVAPVLRDTDLGEKFLIEGEEEIGSPHLPGYAREHARELACDLVISADGAQWRPDEPSLSVASKGLVAFTITVEGARDDLHSGRYGGTVANPAQVLAAILASLHSPDGSVAVPGFYDGATPPSAERLAQLDAVPFDDELFAAQTGVPETYGEAGYSTLQRLWERPTLEVNGVAGGGRYTVIPHVARGFISCRLVGDQDPQRVLAAVRSHVERLDTRGVRVTVEQDGGAVPAYRIDPAHPAIAAATEALRAVYPGQEVLQAVITGTLPATTLFEQVLGAKTLFFSFSTADEKLHAPNEFLRLRRIHEGMLAWDALLTSMADGPHRLQPVNLPEFAEAKA